MCVYERERERERDRDRESDREKLEELQSSAVATLAAISRLVQNRIGIASAADSRSSFRWVVTSVIKYRRTTAV